MIHINTVYFWLVLINAASAWDCEDIALLPLTQSLSSSTDSQNLWEFTIKKEPSTDTVNIVDACNHYMLKQ